jgi:hypothetical protein
LNQNRNQNRRRGRGNNRGGQGGGGNQGNRIDSRARGNAPQMLEKYRKLAHDASLNGDRVLTEYYLQFADHYFRVVADSRPTQQTDQRPRQHDRDQPYGDDFDNEDREDGARAEQPRDRYEEDRPERPERNERPDRAERNEGPRASEGERADEAVVEENPFVREAREPRDRSSEPRERSGQRGRGRARPANDARDEPGEATFDAAVLPPSIARDPVVEEADAPRPARSRARRPKPVEDDGDEALEAVS